MTRTRQIGAALLGMILGGACAAPILTAHTPLQQFRDFENAPPMRIRLITADGRLGYPYVNPIKLVDRLQRRYEEDRSAPIPIQWWRSASLASIDESNGPWFPLGSDSLGRDVWARMLYGSRVSLLVASSATLGALTLGVLVGGLAGFLGGRVEAALMTVADFILVLPAIYMVLAFRSALPLVLSDPQMFWSLTAVLALAGWPVAARGVRAIVASERRKEYAEAAYSVGATPWRILHYHLLPATRGFVVLTGTLMVPAFILTEGTLSLVGMGFRPPTATWGSMLREAWLSGGFADAPWSMAPAAAIVLTVLALQLLANGSRVEGREASTFQ